MRREPQPIPRITVSAPTHEEISRLAYAYWEARGREHGSAENDWYRAERELLGRRYS
jgi:hypothetical protein